MKKRKGVITVTAKGDLGYSPHLRQTIIKGQKYTINEKDFAEELFERPPGWVSPADREARQANKTIEKGGAEK